VTTLGRDITTPARIVTATGATHEEDAPLRSSTGLLGGLFRAQCSHCGKRRGAWCSECQILIENLPITLMLSPTPEVEAVVGSGVYETLLRDAIRALKYQDMRALAVPLGDRLAQALRLAGWQFDVVVPVPLHEARQKERGYNQAALIATRVASAFGVPLLMDGLVRVRDTVSQVGLDGEARRVNLEGAFTVRSALVGQRVLLVDDVMTTGATLSGCAEALRPVAPAAIYSAVVAKTQS